MQNFTKNTLSIIAVAALLLGACTKEKTHTVKEFLHDPELLKTTSAFCNDNPGERQYLPNCVNARQASSERYSGNSLSKCFKSDTVDHNCIDEFFKKYRS